MVKISKAIAANTDLETAQAFVFSLGNLNFIALISSSGDDIFTKVRQLSSDLEDKFFSSGESLPERMSASLSFLKESLKEAEELQVLLASWDSGANILYLQGIGNQKAYLQREGTFIPLIAEEQNSQLVSGFIKVSDKLLLVNEVVFSYLSEPDSPSGIEAIFNTPLEVFEEEINSLSLTHPQSKPLAAAMIDYQQDEEKEVIVEQAPSDEEPSQEPLSQEEIPSLQEPSPEAAGIKDKLIGLAGLVKISLPKSRRGRLTVGIVIVIVLLLGATFSIRNKSNSQKQSEFNSFYSRARDEYSQAQSLKDLDEDQAKQALAKSKQDLSSALAIEPKDQGALDLKKQIDEGSNDILKVYSVSDWSVFLDLNLIKSGFFSQRVSLSLGKILLLDTNQKTLVLVDLQKKQTTILAGAEQLGAAQIASLNGDFGFSYSADKGVVKVDTKATKASLAVKPDSDWGEISDLYGFGGNIYLLDNIKNQIWKYIPAGSGYSDKSPYLKSGVKADFAGGKKLLIDSSVWVLKSGDEIDKYTSGSPDNFSIAGLDKSLNGVSSFFVSDETDNLYVLDKGNSRLVVLKKNGQYLSQYKGDKFSSASDLVVDEQGKKIYLLEGGKIYQIDLH